MVDGRVLDKTTGNVVSLDQAEGGIDKMPKEKGLYQKYIVAKTSGKPLDPNFQAIVLRIDAGRYVHACRQGVKAFAAAVRPFNQTLALDLDFKLLELSQIDIKKREIAETKGER